MSFRKRLFPAVFALVLSGLFVWALFGGRPAPATVEANDTDLERGVTLAIENAVAAHNARDYGAFFSYFTDKGFMEDNGMTKAEAASEPGFFDEPVDIHAIRDIQATSSGATAVLELAFGLGVLANQFDFVFRDGRWLIDGSMFTAPAIPAGTKVTGMKLQEYAFVFDADAVKSGDFAFNVENVGDQEHEVVIAKIEDSVAALPLGDLIDMILAEGESEEPPAFVEDFGFMAFLAPGESGNAVLARTLSPGSYVFVCFVPDTEDGLPHVAKGMISKFNVGSPGTTPSGSGGGAIRPPATGDGGLAD